MSSGNDKFSGKRAIVTGSTSGIGRGIALALLQQGCFVYINGRSQASVDAAIQYFVSERVDATLVQGVVADVGTAEGCQLAFGAITQPIDILINNMGVFAVRDFFEIDDDEWQSYHDKNLMSTVRFSRHYLKGMLERNYGRIINISSEAGMKPLPHMIAYSVSKASQIAFSRGLAELTKGTKVTVNSLLPGPTFTDGVQEYLKGVAEKDDVSVEEATAQYFKANEPTSLIQRFLTVKEVADVACFLASESSSGINGAAQLVEGGIIRHI